MHYPSRLLPLVVLGLGLASACAPGATARRRSRIDPVSHVRVFRSVRALDDLPHRVLDTLAAKITGNPMNGPAEIRLRLAAAEMGANAIAFLDTVGSGKQARLRAIVARLDQPWADVSGQCLRGADGVSRADRLEACERVVASDSTNAEAWRQLAVLRRDAWDWRGERVALEHVVALRPDDATAWYALGRATRGHVDARLAAWRRAAALDTAYQAPRLAIGMQLGERRATAAEAVRWLDDATRLGKRGEALYWRGRALLQLERWDEAHDSFVAALGEGGRLTWCWGGAAYALSRAGRHAEAMAAWDRALAIEPGYFSIVEREADIIDGEKAAWKRSRAALRR